ncbi:MAG: hypothetical protein U9Q77_00030 [Candidatus Marinimicrobia bacterium]|nr:hypothetical protein [Candidatus Neomarinimicrobiota bacterium]
MKSALQFAILLLVGVVTLNAHEHWLYTDSPSYHPGDTITIHIRSGHLGGESEFLLGSHLIQFARIIDPEGQESPLEFQINGQEHISHFLPQQSGLYTILVKLRKRNKGPFSYLLKTQIQIGPVLNTTSTMDSDELEIRPGDVPYTLRVTLAGEPVKVPISLTTGGLEGHSLSMDRHGISTFAADTRGFSIAICHFRRQTASFSFYAGN